MNQEPNFVSGTLWIEDNLRILRGLNSESVDFVYLDPPFNKNRDFEAPIGSKAASASFKDMWTMDDLVHEELGELADQNEAVGQFVHATGFTANKATKAYLTFMAIRLLEIHRVLKNTGAIILHCDDSAGHYLKGLMDAIFGYNNFQNDVTWKRSTSKGDAKKFARISDHLLYYRKSNEFTWNQIFTTTDEPDLDRIYSQKDNRGFYRVADISGPLRGVGDGDSYKPWKGVDIVNMGRMWSAPKIGRYAEYIVEHVIPNYPLEGTTHERLDALYDANMIILPNSQTRKWPGLKRYREADKGIPLRDIILEPTGFHSYNSKNKTGYPTEKPVELLKLLIRACTNENDVVLDPFCGCATTLVAAHILQRQWIGIDLSPLARSLINERISDEFGLWGGCTVPDAPPKRTDQKKPRPYREHAHYLYGVQEGICPGCNTHFPFRGLSVDHMLPLSRGGTDHRENLQLLCQPCNSEKNDKTVAEWKAYKKKKEEKQKKGLK